MRLAANVLFAFFVAGVGPEALPAAAQAACSDPFKIAVERGAKAFTQTRHLNKVARPLVSHGTATIARDRVEWHVTKPLDVKTTITPDGMTQSVENAPPQPLGPQESSNSLLASTGLFDLLVGDFAAARTHYEIANVASDTATSWKLRFTPRQATLAKFIANIEVTGCSGIEQVEVRQANGDRMQISLAGGRQGG